VVRVGHDGIARPRTCGDRARIVHVLRFAVVVAPLEREAARHRFRDARRDIPRPADALVREHDVLDDLVAGGVVDSVHARAVLAGAPVTTLGLYLSGFGSNGNAVVLSTCTRPVSTPVLPI